MIDSYEQTVSSLMEESNTPKDTDTPPPNEEEAEVPEDTAEEIEEELIRLRGELALLQEELKRKEEEQSRVMAELEEFQQLFPEISLKQVPQGVWDQVSQGVPLGAAYALYEKKAAAAELHARRINQKNALRSAGKAGQDAASEYFSPDEVRAMSQSEIRANYQKIIQSMQKWH